MNWSAILNAIISFAEKNPQAIETVISSLINLFASNPPLLAKAVAVGVAHAEAALPPTVVPVKV